jgi:sugar lactone lactonase YvrE
MRTTEARVFLTPDEDERFLPEGPRDVSDLGVGCHAFAWVNIQKTSDPTRGTLHVHNFEPPGEPFADDCPGRPGFLLLSHDRKYLLVGADKSLFRYDIWLCEWQELVEMIPDTNPRTIINDGNVVPGGKAVVFGTKDTKFADPIAHLYLYTPGDNRVSVLVDGQTCSNGKVFAADARGLILYDIDTPTKKVVRYRLDVDARTATPDGTAIDTASVPGFPDGMCDCGDGTVIIAFYNPEPVVAGKAIRFDLSTGRAVEEWTTPGSPRVTCPCLVQRPDGVKLVLTTATEGMPAEQRAKCPNAGFLFIADTDFPICPPSGTVKLSD